MCVDSYGFLVQALEYAQCRPTPVISRNRTLPNISAVGPGSVRRMASELPLDECQALWLVDVCGFSYAAAGRETGTDVETIRARITAGRQRLRAQIGQ